MAATCGNSRRAVKTGCRAGRIDVDVCREESMLRHTARVALVVMLVAAAACGSKKSPVLEPDAAPAPETTPAPPAAPRSNPTTVTDAVPTVPPVRDEAVTSSSLDDLNRSAPLKPVFFPLDSSDIAPA